MRKLIVTEFVSLDGVMEAPGGGEDGYPHAGWVFDYLDPGQQQYKLDEVLESEILLLGRVTYEGFAGAWPERDGEFADKMNNMPKFVASTTLKELEWNNSTLLEGNVADAVSEAQGPGWRAHSRRRQPHARAHADGARPRRRIPGHGLSGRSRVRKASLPGHTRQDPR